MTALLNFVPDKKAAFEQKVPHRQLPREHLRPRRLRWTRRRACALLLALLAPLGARGPAPAGHDDHVEVLLRSGHPQQAILRSPFNFMLLLGIQASGSPLTVTVLGWQKSVNVRGELLTVSLYQNIYIV